MTSKPKSNLDSALSALSLTREKLATCAPLEASLKESIGDVRKAVEAMRFSAAPAILKFLARYDTVAERARKHLPLEAIALAAEVDIAQLLGETMLAFKSLQAQKSTLMVMSAHPEILKKRIKFAKREKNVRDRDAIDTAIGFLPSPKGSSMNLNLNMGPAKVPAAQIEESQEMEDVFPSISSNQQEWQTNKSRLLKETN